MNTFLRLTAIRPAGLHVGGALFATLLAFAPMELQAQDKAGAGKAAAPAAAADPVAARVNGIEIRRSDVNDFIAQLPPDYRQMPMEVIYPLVVNQLVDRKLISAAAEKAKLADEASTKRRLQQARDRVIQEAYIEREIEKKLTDARLRERFDRMMKEQASDASRGEEVRASHILVKTEAEAKDVITEVSKGGDFAEIARKKSTDPGGRNGGDLGWFKKEDMVPEFSAAAFAMKKGEVSKAPVKSQFGWHVIRLEDRRAAKPPAFEEVKDDLRREAAQDVITAMVEDLRKGAKIEQFNADGTPADGMKLVPGTKK